MTTEPIPLTETPLPPTKVELLRNSRRQFGQRGHKLGGRINAELLDAVKHRLGLASDAMAVELALVHLLSVEAVEPWADEAGALDQDFEMDGY
jgi:hypothetical protein